MKRVMQTQLGETDGNCFAACLASILEVDIAEIPLLAIGDGWIEKCNAILARWGFFYVEFKMGGPLEFTTIPDTYVILSRKTVRGPNHAIVAEIEDRAGKRKFYLAHDPYPGGTDFVDEPLTLGFLVPINPAKSKINHEPDKRPTHENALPALLA